MTEEENKVIENFKKQLKHYEIELGDYYKLYKLDDEEYYKDQIEELELTIKLSKHILNLIEKLQKENEDLNNRDTSRLSEIGELRTKNNYLENEIKYYYIPKDKIEKIKNKNIGQYMNFYREIEELLQED